MTVPVDGKCQEFRVLQLWEGLMLTIIKNLSAIMIKLKSNSYLIFIAQSEVVWDDVEILNALTSK